MCDYKYLQTHTVQSQIGDFNLAFFSIPRQYAKLNSSPNFPTIRYDIVSLVSLMKLKTSFTK